MTAMKSWYILLQYFLGEKAASDKPRGMAQISAMEIILQPLKDKDSNTETYMTSLFLTL